MARFSWVSVAVLAACTQVVSYGAVPPTENLLPKTTKGYLSVADVEGLTEAFDKTQLGQLANDPAMKPFVEDLKRQLREKWTQTHQRLGVTWEDLEGVPSGEVAIALVLPNETEHALAILADVTGHQQQADALLAKVAENMAAKKAVRTERRVLDATVVVFEIPKHDDVPAREIVYFVKNDLLAACDSLKVMEGIVNRLAGRQADSLSTLPAFEAITKRCAAAAGGQAPHARWFIEPFGYADAVRLDQPKKRGTDMLKILRTEGFTAVEGIGGFVNFSIDKYEMLHRTFIYAPGNQSGERFTLSARMLKFPNGGAFLPPSWVPRDLAMYTAINLDTKNAFENSKTLVNQIVGDEVFEDVLESIKTDENGPKIDIRRDLIEYLGNRITFLSDLQLPITPKSERLLIAVETKDEKHMAGVIKNWMETDPDTRRREIAGHVVWEIVDEKAELPMVTIENSPLDNEVPKGEEEEEEERALPPNSAVTVAYGQLFIATHIDILTKVLTEYENGPKLAGSADYLRVEAELGRLAQTELFGQAFTRTDEAYRGVYELLRTGKMPESESMLGKLLNSLLGDGKEGVLRPQRIDGSKLPDYDMVRRYLGPAGMTMTAEKTGWLLTGFTLSKEVGKPGSSSDDAPSKPDTVTTGSQ
ncbi:MAG: hypothetical protein WD063_11385 [Pirellulales bacterium]